jgi:hypothetical protein
MQSSKCPDLGRTRRWMSFGSAQCLASIAIVLLAACSDKGSKPGGDQAAGTGAATADAGGSAAVSGSGGSTAVGTSGTGSVTAGAKSLTAGGSAAGSGGAAASASASAGSSGTTPATGGAAGSAGSGMAAAMGCTRELLKSTVDTYFTALAAHDSTKAPIAPMAKFTENGMTVQIGEGLWKTAGEAKLKRSALDTMSCSSVTESVVNENGTDIVFGVRLKLADAKISEIESIVVRKGDYSSNPMALIGTASDDWEAELPADQQSTREQIQMMIDRYFTQFPAGACMFASDCKRYENGFSPGGCSAGLSCSMTMPMGMARGGMMTRLTVIDVEAGIGVGFTMFAGMYTDFHMFKLKGGEVHGVHAILAKASSPGW